MADSLGRVAERLKALAWKARDLTRSAGSNPVSSSIIFNTDTESRKFAAGAINCVGQVSLFALGVIYVGFNPCSLRIIASVLLFIFGLATAVNIFVFVSDYKKFCRDRHVIRSHDLRQRYFDRVIKERKNKDAESN